MARDSRPFDRQLVPRVAPLAEWVARDLGGSDFVVTDRTMVAANYKIFIFYTYRGKFKPVVALAYSTASGPVDPDVALAGGPGALDSCLAGPVAPFDQAVQRFA